MKRILIKASIFVAMLGLLSGCATVKQLEEVRAIAEQAQSSANNASSRADNALATANSALDAARSAQSAADAAQACCNDNSTKLDRMFEKAMTK